MATLTLRADDAGAAEPDAPAKDKTDRPVQPEHPDHPLDKEKPAHPDKPDRGANVQLPEDVKKLIDEFNQARQDFLQDQKELLAQIKDASKEQREKLRDQLKTNREEWLEKQKELREEIRERLKELREKLPNHREIIDEAKGKAKDRKKGR